MAVTPWDTERAAVSHSGEERPPRQGQGGLERRNQPGLKANWMWHGVAGVGWAQGKEENGE